MIKKILNNYKDIKNSGLLKETFQLAYPIVLTNLALNLFSMIDLFFVGKLGAEAIAAVSVGGFFITMIFTAVIAISTGTLALVSRRHGENDQKELSHTAGQSLILGFFLGLLMTGLLYPIIPRVIELIGAKKEVLNLTIDYSRIVVLGSLAYMGQITINGIYRGVGDSRTPLFLVSIAIIINVILDPILIFGLLGFPALGVNGSAIATVLARVLGMILGLYYIFSSSSPVVPDIKRFSPHLMWKILKIGFGGTIQLLSRNLVTLVLIHIAAGFGTIVLAAYGIVVRLQFLVIMAGNGLAIASATMIGKELGQGNTTDPEKPAWAALYIFELMLFIVACIFLFFPENIMKIFSDSAEIIELGSVFIRYFAIVYPIWAFALILGRSMMGSGDTYTPMAITMFNLIILRLPLAYILSGIEGFGAYGLFGSIVITNVTHGLLTLYYFKKGNWKKVSL